jgi:hypothetical protein
MDQFIMENNITNISKLDRILSKTSNSTFQGMYMWPTTYLLTLTFLGCMLNGLSIILLSKCVFMGEQLRVILLNLTIPDFLLYMIIFLLNLFKFVENQQPTLMHKTIKITIYVILSMSSLMFVCVLSIDRFVYIFRPSYYIYHATTRNAWISCTVVWAYSFITITILYPTRNFVNAETSSLIIRVGAIFLFVTGFILCTISNMYMFMKINKKNSVHSCNYHRKILRRSYKSTFIIFTIIGGTYICYFPAFVYYILCDITIEDACHYTTFANVKNICILLHGILYPIFYILRLKECQIIFFNIFCRFSQKLLDKAHRMKTNLVT